MVMVLAAVVALAGCSSDGEAAVEPVEDVTTTTEAPTTTATTEPAELVVDGWRIDSLGPFEAVASERMPYYWDSRRQVGQVWMRGPVTATFTDTQETNADPLALTMGLWATGSKGKRYPEESFPAISSGDLLADLNPFRSAPVPLGTTRSGYVYFLVDENDTDLRYLLDVDGSLKVVRV
jgi:hypothetical protein